MSVPDLPKPRRINDALTAHFVDKIDYARLTPHIRKALAMAPAALRKEIDDDPGKLEASPFDATGHMTVEFRGIVLVRLHWFALLPSPTEPRAA